MYAEEFPYPTMPDSLRTVDARLEYLMDHYWDGYNFSDTTLVKSEATEQGFVNYADLLTRVDSALVVHSVKRFAELTRPGVPTREAMQRLTEHYLGDPESPMRNDLLYAVFLEQASSVEGVDIAERTRSAYMVSMLRKNNPGDKATDFELTLRNGQSMRLSDITSEYTVLYFNDPDCENCHRVTEELKKEPLLSDPRIRVVAVYPEDDRQKWQVAEPQFPTQWIDGWSTDGAVTAEDLYYLPALPVIYLLDKEKNIIIKDPSPEQLIQALHSILKQETIQ